MKRLSVVPAIRGVAGPASFRRRLTAGLEGRGYGVSEGLDGAACDAVLVVGATRHLSELGRAKRRGIPIVQRLDGMNWIHRRRPTGLTHFLRAEVNNLLLRRVRANLADIVVYQSDFVRRWWDSAIGAAPGRSAVVRNGVPLDVFTPDGPRQEGGGRMRLLVLEGAIGGGYEIGLTWAAQLAALLAAIRPVELVIVGAPRMPRGFALPRSDRVQTTWLGEIPPEQVPGQMRSSALLFSADLHPACPNSVIEALACGLPVVAFDTGAISEIVDAESGAVVPYGSDPWKIGPPDVPRLAGAAEEVLRGAETYRRGARRRAEAAFGLERMIDDYLDVLGWDRRTSGGG